MDSPTDQGRRSFLGLRGARPTKPTAVRPPWTSTQSLSEHCTHCAACVAACPENILVSDPTGMPMVDFQRGGCTFCGDCATACEPPVFDLTRPSTLPVQIAISDRCLPKRGVVCESCRDVCMDRAIRFDRGTGRVSVPTLLSGDCTGCGLCLAVCPVNAIAISADA